MVVRVVLLLGLSSGPSHATELETECPALSAAERDELDARLNLLLQSRSEEPPAVVELRCSAGSTRVAVVDGSTTSEDVDASHGLVDGALDAVERALERRSELSEESADESNAPEAGASEPLGGDVVGDGAQGSDDGSEPVPHGDVRDAGGLGLGLTSEYAFEPIGTLVGPRLDLAVGSGPYAASLVETARFSSARGRSVFDFDVLAGFGFGAPYVSTHDFGAHAAVGVEWLSGGLRRTRLTDSSVVAQASVRMAWPVGRVSLWASLDVRARFQPLTLSDPINARLPRVSPMLSLGAVVLADGR